jgi:hypothetical protein
MKLFRVRRNVAILTFALSFLPLPASADVSIVLQGQGSRGKSANESFTKTIRIKGSKMRVENRHASDVSVTIYDLEAGKRFRLDPVRKEIFVVDLQNVGKKWKEQTIEKKLTRNIQPTGKRKEISGMSCDEYTFELTAPVTPWHGELGQVKQIARDDGTVCVSESIPAGIEYTTFVHEAKRRGYWSAAAACSPTFSLIGPYFYGEQPNVIVLSAETESGFENNVRTGRPDFDATKGTTTVLTINSDAISDEEFRIPSDWKVKKDPQFD